MEILLSKTHRKGKTDLKSLPVLSYEVLTKPASFLLFGME